MNHTTLSRRTFILGSGAGALGIGFGGIDFAHAQAQAFSPVAWVSIAADNTATIYSAGSEMGQGTMTSLPAVVAEHMELDWARVRVQHAPPDAKRFGNPRFGGGLLTGASRTVQGYYEPLSLAGLQGKLVMLGAAAAQWNVPVSELKAENSMVVHAASNRRVSYGELARTASAPAELPKVDKTMLKPMAQFKLIGKDLTRVDLAGKTSGSAVYGIDVRLPGMLYATVLRAPVQGEKPEKIDDDAAKKIAGYVKTVPMPYGVGIIAETYPAAKAAKAAATGGMEASETPEERRKVRRVSLVFMRVSGAWGCSSCRRKICRADTPSRALRRLQDFAAGLRKLRKT